MAPTSRKRSYSGKRSASRKKFRRSTAKGRPMRFGAAANARSGGFNGIELKFIDYRVTSPGFALAATVTTAEHDPTGIGSISAIAQGDGEENRDGRKCTLTAVNVKGFVTLQALNNDLIAQNPVTCRVALVWDTQTNGVQLNSEDVFTQGLAPYGYRNLQYTKRFKVLADRTFTMNYGGGAGSGTNDWVGDRQEFSFNKKINIPVLHSGTTAVVASCTDNSLHIIAWASDGAKINLNYNSRIRFVG